jgi:putative SOS response-associated peptidase YedK
MCGRFALSAKTDDVEKLIPGLKSNIDIKPRYNIAPTQNISVIKNDGKKEISNLYWGLIPFWSKDPAIGQKMINARSETIFEKPAFKNPVRKKRCLIIASGFYEWEKSGKQKIPHYIRMKSGKPFTFAGIWDSWKNADDVIINSASIITTAADDFLQRLHDRMPVFIPEKFRELWVSDSYIPDSDIRKMLGSYPENELEMYQVTTKMNSPLFESEECIVPVV